MSNPYAVDLVNCSDNSSVSGADFKATLDTFVQSLKDARRKDADNAVSILAPGLAQP